MYDPAKFAQHLMHVYETAQPVFQEFLIKQTQELQKKNYDPLNITEAYTKFWEQYLNDPYSFWSAQADLWQGWMDIWQSSTRKILGEDSTPVIQPSKGDRRFASKEWQENALFDFIKQSYLLTANWMEKTVRETQGLDETQKEKLAFSARLFAEALSPTNFVMTNPDVLKETMESGGENLIRGFENLVEDLKRGHGDLKISTTDYEAFEVGKNLATTPGSVIYENDLMQLIQYKPTTDMVHQTPLLIVPPWINKYYILDLKPENSLIKYLVDQGHTVFTISWVNPTKELAQKRFEDYMQEGVLDALDQIENIAKETDNVVNMNGSIQTNVIGYCLGGTLLAITLAYLKAKGHDNRIKSATFLTTLLDFKHAGEMKIFLDDTQLELMDRAMAESGVFEARELQRTFSLLRANDLIWSFVVNNYLMGKEPFPFDLLYWNDDSTNMPAAMHSFYLRKMYRDNKLTEAGGITMNGVDIDLSTIETPAYFLSTRDDHIAPWKATYEGAKLLGSKDKTFTLAASGHIAGVVNSPVKNKYCYWSAPEAQESAEEWDKSAAQSDGSWWPHWQNWIKQFAGVKVKPRAIKNAIEDAPGSYVKMKT